MDPLIGSRIHIDYYDCRSPGRIGPQISMGQGDRHDFFRSLVSFTIISCSFLILGAF